MSGKEGVDLHQFHTGLRFGLWCLEVLGIIAITFPAFAPGSALPDTPHHACVFSFLYLLAVPHGLWDLSILVPQAGIELTPPAVEAWSLNHRTARNVPCQVHFR